MSPATKIKILIVDDHDMVRQGLSILFAAFDDCEVVGETDDPHLVSTLCKMYRPDVILMDLLMPRMDGITAIQSIHERFPEIRIVVLTSSADEQLIQAAFKAGAIGYILKTGSIDEVAQAVRAAYSGSSKLSPDIMRSLLSKLQHPTQTGYDLTKQERIVLALLVRGLSNKEIADHLTITLSTAKAHVNGILTKLKVTNRARAVTLAMQTHLLDNEVN